MLPGKCWYTPGQVGEQAASLAGVVQDFWRAGWEPLVRGGIDGYNISEFLIDKRCGLEWHYAAAGQTGPKKLCAPALSETQVPAMRRKGPSGSTQKYGLEFVVDPTGPGSTYGRVCVVSKTDLTKQIGSLIPQDPVAVANPKFDVRANYGKATFGTSAAFDWELHRNGAASLADDGSAVGTTRTLFRLGTLSADVAYPALKRLSSAIQARLANDSAFAGLHAGDYQVRDNSDNVLGDFDSVGVRINNNGVLAFSDNYDSDNVSTALKRGGADGTLLLYDYQGGTGAVFQLGGTSSSYPAIKRSSTRAQTKLADDSAYAGHDAGTLDLYGASTTKRSRIDPGTPAADTISTLPNRTGNIVQAPSALTVNVLSRTDSNGDLVDSAVSDDGTTVTVARTTMYGSSALTIASGNHASGIVVRGGEAAASAGRPATFRGGEGATDNNGGAATFRGGDGGTASIGAPNGGAVTSRGGDATGSGTGGSYTTRAGTSPSGTKGVWDAQTPGGTSRITINADGTVTQAGDHTFSGTLTATADALVGNFRLNSTTQTASNAGNYAVAATIAAVYVDANALTGGQNYDVTLPSAVTYANRRVVVKITVVGAGGSTVTVKSSAGTVEGAAAGTGVPLDASARSKVTYQSDGTSWWSV